MASAQSPHLSNTRVDKAGALLRSWMTDSSVPTDDSIEAAFKDVWAFRSGVANPLKKTTVGVRQFVDREKTSELVDRDRNVRVPVVGQRTKRAPQIVDKLMRFHHMRLSQMDDIGGCRAVMGTETEIDAVIRRMRKNHWDIRRVDDYRAHPKATGYRAVHVVLRRDGQLLEVQFRTPSQHEWAEAVDRTALRVDDPLTVGGLKDGVGPPELLRYFERAAFAMALEDAGQAVDEAFEREFQELREQVYPYFPRKE